MCAYLRTYLKGYIVSWRIYYIRYLLNIKRTCMLLHRKTCLEPFESKIWVCGHQQWAVLHLFPEKLPSDSKCFSQIVVPKICSWAGYVPR